MEPPPLTASAPRPGVAADHVPTDGSIYRAGRLWYTPRGLARLFCWLLGGDFAFSFFEQIFGRFIPLYANDLHASNTLIGIMTGSVAGLMNALFLPNISMASDRHRGPLGRRIPFLLWATPCTVGALLLIGFAPELGHGAHALTASWLPVTETALTLGLLCLCVVAYHFFNMVLVNAYNWLIRDVVPTVVIGRFLSWFRVVTTLSSFIFLRWVFPQLTSHREAVFVAVGLVYVAVFAGMCWRVKEGGYPPPPPAAPGRMRSSGAPRWAAWPSSRRGWCIGVGDATAARKVTVLPCPSSEPRAHGPPGRAFPLAFGETHLKISACSQKNFLKANPRPAHRSQRSCRPPKTRRSTRRSRSWSSSGATTIRPS